MIKIKKVISENGFFSIAFGILVVVLFSVIAIAHIGVADTHDLANNYKVTQYLHLLRSETMRGVLVAKDQYNNPSSPVGPGEGISTIDLSQEINKVDAGIGKFTFEMRSKVLDESASETTPFISSTSLSINSLGRAYTGHGRGTDSNISIFSKKVIKSQTFAGFHYFTDNESSINSDKIGGFDPVKFWGPDEIYGIVRSNTDIYIQNGGGGNNNGWPYFHNRVYTAGEIKPFGGGSIPELDVFNDGYEENVPPVEFPENADLARTGRIVPVDPGDIIMATIDGAGYSMWYGDQTLSSVDSVVVYDLAIEDDPDTWEREDSLGVQYLTNVDTLWNFFGSGRVLNNSIFVTGKLWIQGTFAGKQTWACQDTMYLTGDILLSGTDKGTTPDGFNPETNEYTGPINHNDYVGLVSEKSIVIQYGYKTWGDSIIVKNNCGREEDIEGDQGDGGIYIYAAMAALGQGETSMEDGVFSFQYQHPHPGTVVRVDDNWVLKEDVPAIPNDIYAYAPYDNGWGPLHFFYRDERDMDWHPDYSFPYYGPLWPEPVSETFMERGTINLWGSVAQRRRGFVHRSGSDPLNTGSPEGWDLENYWYGSHPDDLGLPNAQGASGSGVGYKKNYNYDHRFMNQPPPKFPQVHLEGGKTEFDTASWYLFRAEDAPADLTF